MQTDGAGPLPATPATVDAPAPRPAPRRIAGPRSRRQGAFLGLVTLVGLPVTLGALLALPSAEWAVGVPALAVLAAVLVAGELMPIEVARHGRSSDEITISSTAALALAFVAPLGFAMAAQAVPLVVDDLRRRKHWSRPLFNVSQYALTFVASRLVFSALSGQAFLRPEMFEPADLPAAFAAGAAFFVVNHALVGAAVALDSREPVLAHLRDDIRFQLATSGLLVCLSPAVLAVSMFSLWLVPVMLLPIVAVRTSTRLALQRHLDAVHDGLTGLPNRKLLRSELDRALEELARAGDGLAVMFIDLDHFKEINDTLGHQVGDSLIVEVAGRLAATAGDAALVARLGGDEFAVLAHTSGTDADREAQAVTLAERLTACLEEPVTLAGVRLEVRASLGIALAPAHGETADELLSRADVAMYQAKARDGAWAMYDPQEDRHTPQRLALLGEMRDGLGRGEFVLHYQPKCDAVSGAVIGAEALVRWQHPTRGLLPPDEFIPLMEATELIPALTLTVLEQAVREARSWLDGGRRLGVAVNLSARHLADQRLPEHVRSVLQRHALPAELLTLEVTESTVMQDPTRAAAVLALLREDGVRIAVDDYGTGHSSLAYLKRLAIDELMVDRSFVSGMAKDESDRIIVRSTVDLGHNLGLGLVAEGVEDLATWRALAALGCDIVQGYVLSRPCPGNEFSAWLTRWDEERGHRLVPPPRESEPVSGP
jgi:diguanylate cyclase (GGDEF)-like protein